MKYRRKATVNAFQLIAAVNVAGIDAKIGDWVVQEDYQTRVYDNSTFQMTFIEAEPESMRHEDIREGNRG